MTRGRDGAATTAAQVLKGEHRVIERVLDAVERMVQRGTVDRTFFEPALAFFWNFADGCHHAKEENELFPVLESAESLPDGGMIKAMLREREQGRALLGVVASHLHAAADGELRAVETVCRAAMSYVAVLRRHIQREDKVLFVRADAALGPEEQLLMLGALHRADETNGNAAKRRHYTAVADELARRSGASA